MGSAVFLQQQGGIPMKSLSMIAIAAAVAGLASACSVRTETVERPAPVATVATSPAPATIVYTDPAPATTTVYTR
jgi:hypothetical protein